MSKAVRSRGAEREVQTAKRRAWRDRFAKILMARYRPAVARRGTHGVVEARRD
jgi:hypothetical protein